MSKQPKSHLKRLATFDYINSAILLLVAVCCVYPFLYSGAGAAGNRIVPDRCANREYAGRSALHSQ